MNKENETISDIVAEMKNLVKSNGTKSRTNIPTLTIRAWLSLANRIEAAYKREVADLTRECERLKEERNRSGLAARAEVSERLHALTKENERLRAALKNTVDVLNAVGPLVLKHDETCIITLGVGCAINNAKRALKESEAKE